MRAAAIDIGTNSVLLLVVEKRGDELATLVERATITRLGQGVDKARELAPDAVERTLACLERYADEIGTFGVDRVDAVGTSAMRDARGGEAFVARASAILGTTPRVISGEEEARLTFSGALAGLHLPPGPVMVFDVGGGSTELIVGEVSGSIGSVSSAMSLDVGSVRLTERHIRRDPPGPKELDAVRNNVRAELTKASALLSALAGGSGAPNIVGVAGTVTTLAALVLGIDPYDGARVHGARLTRPAVAANVGRVATLPLAERRALRAIDPARADVIVAGGILVGEVLAWVSASELVTSDRGVRWGLALNLLAN